MKTLRNPDYNGFGGVRIVGPRGSLSGSRNPVKAGLVPRPRSRFMGSVKADKATFPADTSFWGCSEQNFGALLPFYGMRENFAAS